MARKIDSFFGALPRLERATREAKRSAALRHAVQALLPPALARACTPIVVENRAIIYAANGAVAAKLRQLMPTLSSRLRSRGFEVTAISVEVQATLNAPKPLKRTLSAPAARSLRELSAELSPSPLKAALERLAKRHGDEET